MLFKIISKIAKNCFLKWFNYSKTCKEFSTLQEQAVIKLPGQKDREKRLMNNWKPKLLLNTDMSTFYKSLGSKNKICASTCSGFRAKRTCSR